MDQRSASRVLKLSHHLSQGTVSSSSHALPLDGTVKVAITGAAGYVGSWLVTLCLQRGHTVRACVRDVGNETKTAFLKNMPEYGHRLTLHSADMTKEGAYDTIFDGLSLPLPQKVTFIQYNFHRSTYCFPPS